MLITSQIYSGLKQEDGTRYGGQVGKSHYNLCLLISF